MTLSRLDVPIGTVLDYAGQSVPQGYLECDGSAVSRTTYPLLFAAIGTAWGAGNGSTTFNLPNLGGRTCIGKGSRSVGNTGGSETHTLTASEMPSHKHSVGAHAHGLNSHKHSVPKHGHGFTQPTASSKSLTGNFGYANNALDNWWADGVFSKSNAGTNGWTGNSSNSRAYAQIHIDASHSHSCTGGAVQDKAAFDTGAASGNTANSTAFDSGATGGGSSHSIMQPYAVVRKIIRAA